MKMVPVVSSNIASVGYDKDTQELAITFNTGATYIYSGVPEGEHEALMSAPSVGKYFHANIRPEYKGVKQI